MDLRKWVERSVFEWDRSWTDMAQCAALSASGIALAAACNVGLTWENVPQRSLRIVGTVGAAYLCLVGARQSRELARLSTLYDCRQKFRIEAAKTIYAKEIANLTNPAFNPEPITLRPFDWTNLRNTVEFPHISIEGKTGQGKSTLAEYLCTVLGGRVIAIAPHWKPGDFASADLICGVGRDYGQSVEAEALVDWADILGGQVVTVTGFMKSLHHEMTARFKAGGDHEAMNIILDEFNAYANRPGLGEIFTELIRESRKVGIRLILLCHGSEVKALGIVGEGSLRMSLTRIRLGNFAKEHASMKLNKCKLHSPDYLIWAAIRDHFKLEKRPALVDDELAIVPPLSRSDIPTNPQQRILGQSHTATQPQSSAQWLESCLALPCADTATQPQSPEKCPHCGGTDTKRNGSYKGKPRLQCKSCKKTWSQSDANES